MNFALFLEMHARGTPNAAALIDRHHRLSWRELDVLANRFADRLTALGLGRRDRLALFLPNRAETVIAFCGALKAGVVPVPLNYRLNGSDLLRVIEHCAPACLITTAEKMDALTDATVPRVLTVDDTAASGSFWDEVAQGSPQLNTVGCQSGDIANLLYTSGTTSTPKAAIHTHGMRVAVAGAMADCFKLSRADIALAVSPIFHTSGMSVMSNALFAGATLVLQERWDVAEFARLVTEERVTFMHLISTIIVDIARAPAALFPMGPKTVRFTWGGGHNVDSSLLELFEHRVGGVLLQGYSRTEGGLAYNPLDQTRRRFDMHGYANRNSSDVAIIDPATGLLCPPDTTGEIVVRGDGVSPGYWDHEFTRVRTPYDGGWQPTGDLGMLSSDGALRFLGRSDHMIKTGGENVYPAEIAEILLKLPGIADAVVLGIPDPRLGEKIAALVVRSDPALSELAVETACRAVLPGFKIPRRVVFIDALPRLGTEKIDLAACRRRLVAAAIL